MAMVFQFLIPTTQNPLLVSVGSPHSPTLVFICANDLYTYISSYIKRNTKIYNEHGMCILRSLLSVHNLLCKSKTVGKLDMTQDYNHRFITQVLLFFRTDVVCVCIPTFLLHNDYNNSFLISADITQSQNKNKWNSNHFLFQLLCYKI